MTAVSAERVRTQIDGLAAAGLDWTTFGAAAIETLRTALPFSAACLATVDPATELVTATVKWGDVDDDHDLEWSYYEYEVDDVYDFRRVCRKPGAVAALGADEDEGARRRGACGQLIEIDGIAGWRERDWFESAIAQRAYGR